MTPRQLATAAAVAADSTSVLRILQSSSETSNTPSSYPPISSIPRTTPDRLAEASESNPSPPTASSVLYLAYGSNLCAETFLGARGIRPLSQVNVSAPTLRLVFDLPGMPYREPCFANTAPRKLPKSPIPNPDLPFEPPRHPTRGLDNHTTATTTIPAWNKGLIGVVYEVTPEDYAKIVATEGGGSSYADIIVPCLPLPPSVSVPEKPPLPELPRPFLAHTLYYPNLPDIPNDPPPGSGDPNDPNNPDHPDDPRKKWYWRFIKRPAREPGYAQPSARYLHLITDGAAEHELPADYQAYLAALQPYTITSRRQRVGQLLLTAIAGPGLLILMGLSRLVADKNGNIPSWLAVGLSVWFNLIWMAYDGFFKKVFGDGERTQEEKNGDKEDERRSRMLRLNHGVGTDEEKASLLSV
jgi:hypothetical protein